MIKFDEYKNENKKEHNFNWPNVSDHPSEGAHEQERQMHY